MKFKENSLVIYKLDPDVELVSVFLKYVGSKKGKMVRISVVFFIMEWISVVIWYIIELFNT